MQDNVICSYFFPLMCDHLSVPLRQGPWCYDYSARVKCCSPGCGSPPTLPTLTTPAPGKT